VVSTRSRLGRIAGVALASVAGSLLLAGQLLLELPGRIEARLDGRAYNGFRCNYRESTGRPCVGCGGTTAFLLARRGRVDEAWRESAFGLGAAAALFVLTLGGLVTALTGRMQGVAVAATAATVFGGGGLVVQAVRWWGAS
jgi:hypothetical protein